MHEIGVEPGQILTVFEGLKQLFTHRDQRGSAAWRKIKPAQQFQPARLGGAVQVGGGSIRRCCLPRVDRGIDPRPIRTEPNRRTNASKNAIRGPTVNSR
jgi:hypothetical protein